MAKAQTVLLDGDSLTPEAVEAVARQNASVKLSEKITSKIQKSRQVVEDILKRGDVVYSINTGFGDLSRITIPMEDVDQLQLNLVRSTAAGRGDSLSKEVSRSMMLLRANALAKGCSGVRIEVIQLLIDMLNNNVHPVIPSQGSLGASGDLAPLAHLALVLIGEGEAEVEGKILSGDKALAKAGLKPVVLKAKEGLALINGTQMMTAIGTLALIDSERLCTIADISASMSLEGFLGSHKPFRKEVQDVRPHPGQIKAAENCRKLLDKSELAKSHAGCKKVQDPYSYRCIPQVHGAVRDTVSFVRSVIERELNSATDNPLIFSETGEAVSQGNFHGEPVAFALDYLAIAMSELGNISERRIDKLNDPHFSELPAYLTQGKEGLNCGTMIAHYTAASLVSENKILAHPASVDSIPSSNNKEDHVSMGSIAARKAAKVVEHVGHILATEVYAAVHALRLRAPLKPGKGVQIAFDFAAKEIPPLVDDRVMADEIARFAELLRNDTMRTYVLSQMGDLN